jgi:hypothetical protein
VSVRTVFSAGVPQNATFLYQCQLQDEKGVALPAAILTSLTLTVYALITGNPIVNSLSKTNILNDGVRGVLDTGGNLSVTLQPADMALVTTPPADEQHILLFEWTWGSGKSGTHEVQILVKAITRQ